MGHIFPGNPPCNYKAQAPQMATTISESPSMENMFWSSSMKLKSAIASRAAWKKHKTWHNMQQNKNY